ncbi:hypothetical protein [Paracidovorax sp. MALMAid1276]|uniref:hypothetical protein n=1 Tax=Paracidovorax sp. MALMAid1276 TaxID=3411631 RepID=UPI003B9B80F6
MMRPLRAFGTTVLLGGALIAPAIGGPTSTVASSSADPVSTQKALRALFAAANDSIPAASSCHGNFGPSGQAKVKDLLAMRMAYLYAGVNVIEGGCSITQCAVSIKHAAGEDVASAVISFNISAGKARASSLQCVITP